MSVCTKYTLTGGVSLFLNVPGVGRGVAIKGWQSSHPQINPYTSSHPLKWKEYQLQRLHHCHPYCVPSPLCPLDKMTSRLSIIHLSTNPSGTTRESFSQKSEPHSQTSKVSRMTQLFTLTEIATKSWIEAFSRDKISWAVQAHPFKPAPLGKAEYKTVTHWGRKRNKACLC